MDNEFEADCEKNENAEMRNEEISQPALSFAEKLKKLGFKSKK